VSGAQPWMKFYPRDWRADEKLRVCSLAARGLWMEMLALMHGSERYGHLLINGKAPTDAQLAVLAGAPSPQVVDLLGELEEAGVFSRSASGAIYSRRMIADEKKARTARKNGKNGGNPSLCNYRNNSASDNQEDKAQDKGGLKLRGQKPEKNKANALQKRLLDPDWKAKPFGEGTQSREITDSWSPKELKQHLEAFRAHHIGRGNKWADWQQAWSTWVLNSRNFGRPNAPASDNFLEVYSKEIERREAAH
jgi:hypothetical protein